MSGAVATTVTHVLFSFGLFPLLNAAALMPRPAGTEASVVPPPPEPADVVTGDCGCAPAPLPPEPGTPVELRCVWTLLPGPVETIREESVQQSHILATLANCRVPEIDSQEVKYLVPTVRKVTVSSAFSQELQREVNRAALDALKWQGVDSPDFRTGKTSSCSSKETTSVGCKTDMVPNMSVVLETCLIVDTKVIALPMGHKWVVSWYRNGAWTPWQTHSACEGKMASVTVTGLVTRLSGCEVRKGPPCEDSDPSPVDPEAQPAPK